MNGHRRLSISGYFILKTISLIEVTLTEKGKDFSAGGGGNLLMH
jgi:hypothetical protein